MSAVAIVTGGAGGLGTAICTELARRGNRVVIGYRSSGEAAQTLVDRFGADTAIAVQADLGRSGAADALVAAAVERFGTVDVLVNNAGTMSKALVEDMTDDEWQESLDVNLTSAFRMSRAVIPGMKQAQGGRIINVSSQAAFRGSIGRAHYAAAKAGMLGLTYSLARELGPFAVTVNAVVPGRFMSEMLAAHSTGQEASWLEATPLGRFGEPAELASVVGFLSSSEAAYVTGTATQVGGGLVMG